MEQLKPHVTDYAQKYLMKRKHYEKLLSSNGIWATYLRTIDVEPLMPYNLWLSIYPFDLSQLGIGLIFSIVGFEFEALMLGFTYELPSARELEQGITIKFTPIDWSAAFPELKDFDLYLDVNFVEEHKPSTARKAYYGRSRYDESYYDPAHFVEVITATIWRLRQLNPSDPLYEQTVSSLAELLGIQEATLDFITDKVSMILSAQEQTFILGLGVLDVSTLQEPEDGFVKFTFKDHEGNVREVYVKSLSDLLYGIILDVTPLGYGILLPEEDIHELEDGKGDPKFMTFLQSKNKAIADTIPLLAFSFSNYQTYSEMADHHANLRVSQYDALNHIRNAIENWVEMNVPPEEADPVRIRQYQNAVLHFIGLTTKRHAWGMDLYKQMSEEDLKSYWLSYWTAQGLKESTLNKLYEGMKVWMKAILREKQSLSSKVQAIRKSLALT